MLDPDISTADARRLLSAPAHLGDVRRAQRLEPTQVPAGRRWRGARWRCSRCARRPDGPRPIGSRPPRPRRAARVRRAAGRRARRHPGRTSCCTAATTVSTPSSRTPTIATTTICASQADVAIPAGQVLPLDGTFGLHPSLTYTKQLWDAGQVAIVHGVGYPNPDLSHFTSMAIWMNGRFGVGAAGTGWIGRWLDGQPPADADLVAATIGSSVPLHLLGAVCRAVGVPANGGNLFGTGTDAGRRSHVQRPSVVVRERCRTGSLARLLRRCAEDRARPRGEGRTGVFARRRAATSSSSELTIAARLINANLGFRVLDLGLDSFDTHDGEPLNHAALLTQLDTGSVDVLRHPRSELLQPSHDHDDVGVRSHAVFQRLRGHRSRHGERAVRASDPT